MNSTLFIILFFWSFTGGMIFTMSEMYEFDDNMSYLQRLFVVALCGPLTLALWLFCIFIVRFFDALGTKK